MVTLTIILLVSTAFVLGDTHVPIDGIFHLKTPCELARDAATHGPIGGFIPTCDYNGQYTPEQCWGSTGYCWCVNSSGQKIPDVDVDEKRWNEDVEDLTVVFAVLQELIHFTYK
ncbi:equistatin-like [Oncorhynchus keta]|uniref:equistatin-like n=1 Tax=Oncorhynchus keta TaxID=8018 RepID=UPI00227C0B8B|nr:equistatin-like [Oncorhynchus keta]XP_052353948.1 equistatin-like [Oncorhynchus keta]